MRLLIERKDHKNKSTMHIVEVLLWEHPSTPKLPYKIYWRFENQIRVNKAAVKAKKPYVVCEALGYKLIHEL